MDQNIRVYAAGRREIRYLGLVAGRPMALRRIADRETGVCSHTAAAAMTHSDRKTYLASNSQSTNERPTSRSTSRPSILVARHWQKPIGLSVTVVSINTGGFRDGPSLGPAPSLFPDKKKGDRTESAVESIQPKVEPPSASSNSEDPQESSLHMHQPTSRKATQPATRDP